MKQDYITHVLKRALITDLPIFRLLVAHKSIQNTEMLCPLRIGDRGLEYNPDILDEMRDAEQSRAFLTEELSLALGHPYTAAPEGCTALAVSIGSALEVGGNYWVNDRKCSLLRPGEFDLPNGQTFEWYAKQIQSRLDDGLTIEHSDALNERVELWKEDKEAQSFVASIASLPMNWGSLTEKLRDIIKERFHEKADWREMLAHFCKIGPLDLISPEALLTGSEEIEEVIRDYSIPQLNVLNHDIFHFLSDYSGNDNSIWEHLSAYYDYLIKERPVAATSFTDLFVDGSYYKRAMVKIASSGDGCLVPRMIKFVNDIR